MTLVGVAPRFHILFVTHDKTKLTQTRTAGDARKWWQLCFVRTLATDRALYGGAQAAALYFDKSVQYSWVENLRKFMQGTVPKKGMVFELIFEVS